MRLTGYSRILARKAVPLALMVLLGLAPAVLRAGVNTWTGGRPLGAPSGSHIVAVDPSSPHIVYAADDSDLYRSSDGGRSWTRIGSFNQIQSLLVDPASPSTLYVGAPYPNPSASQGVLKSKDGGLTWSQTPINDVVTALAVSTTNDTLYGGGSQGIYKSTDGGNHWGPPSQESFNHDGRLTAKVAALVIDPKHDATIYAGGEEDVGYYYSSFSSSIFSKSTDGGATWKDLSAGLGAISGITAIAIDSVNSSTLFVGLARGDSQGVLRSADGGVSWSRARNGLPAGANVFSLAMDPQNSSTLYAGTDSGVYRTRDAGATWGPFGQQLGGTLVHSLALDRSGRILHAGTDAGPFDLEIGAGTLDVSSGAADQNRILFWDADRLSVRTLDESGNWTSTPFEGPFSAWTATAISDGADRLSRVLWQNGDGRVSLEVVGSAGSQDVFHFAAEPGWTAIDVSVGVDGRAHLLWTSATGQMRIVSVDSSGVAIQGQTYGPYDGWSARAIADGPDGATWTLWRRTDGVAGISRWRAGALEETFRWNAIPGWTTEDVAVGTDGLPRLLWTNPDGRMAVWSIDAQGQLTAGKAYSNPGFEARRIAASADGLTRVLWSAEDGSSSLWLFSLDNSLNSQLAIPAPPPTLGALSGYWTGTFATNDSADCGPAIAGVRLTLVPGWFPG